MIFLLLAIISSALVSVIMRLSTAKVPNNVGMLAVNYLTCIVAAVLYVDGFKLFPQTEGLAKTIALGGINGFLYLASFVIFQYSVKKSGVVLSSVFMKLGMLVPIVASVAFFGEVPSLLHVIGFALATSAIVMINKNDGTGEKANILTLVFLLLLSGGAEGMSKVFEEVGPPSLSSQFLFYTFVFAFVLCVSFMLLKKQRICKNELIYGIAIGIPNFFSAKFVLRALADVPAIIVFPSFAVATILAVSLAGVFAFKEKLSKLQWAAVAIIVITLVILGEK